MLNLNSKTWTCFWRVGSVYNAKHPNGSESYTERRERRKVEAETLKAAGFKTEYLFHFKNTDPKSVSDKQKVLAEECLDEIKRNTGITTYAVMEGSYL